MPKMYSSDFRALVLEKIRAGMSQRKAAIFFNLNLSTVCRWVNGYTPSLPSRRKPRKLDDTLLTAYIEDHSDSTLKEIAAHFNVSISAVHKRLGILGITRKKNHLICRARRGKKA